MYLQISIGIIVIFLFSISLYIKYKFGFWREQPVFHIYDFMYYIFPPGLIMTDLPKVNKYCNLKDIKTTTQINAAEFTIFIQNNFLQNGQNKYEPKTTNIVPYFTGHNCNCFFSNYYVKELTNALTPKEKLIATISSRPLNVNINNKRKDAQFSVYYVDHLCVLPEYRKKGIAPEMIQTHEYQQRHQNKKIQISLFKREGEMTGIIPLTTYYTFLFDIQRWKPYPKFLPYVSLIECNKNNIQILLEFLKEQNSKFEINILPEISNILELIKTENIFIYYIQKQERILAAYFFRNTVCKVEQNREILMCIASINCCQNMDLFVHGYKLAFQTIQKTHPRFQFSGIENTSDSSLLIREMKKKYATISKIPTAYFFYNFAYPTFHSEKVFILN